jgi:hypothetical protein
MTDLVQQLPKTVRIFELVSDIEGTLVIRGLSANAQGMVMRSDRPVVQSNWLCRRSKC